MHADCDPRISIEEALSDLLTAVSRLGEPAAYVEGPAIEITVDQDRP